MILSDDVRGLAALGGRPGEPGAAGTDRTPGVAGRAWRGGERAALDGVEKVLTGPDALPPVVCRSRRPGRNRRGPCRDVRPLSGGLRLDRSGGRRWLGARSRGHVEQPSERPESVLAVLVGLVAEPGFEGDDVGRLDGDGGAVPAGALGNISGPGEVLGDGPSHASVVEGDAGPFGVPVTVFGCCGGARPFLRPAGTGRGGDVGAPFRREPAPRA